VHGIGEARGAGITQRDHASRQLDRIAGAKAIEVSVRYTVVTVDVND
jgi:hypothetical protein